MHLFLIPSIFFALTTFKEIPVLEMKVAGKDTISSNEETCFGCGDCSIYCELEGNYTVLSSSSLSTKSTSSYSAKNLDDYNLRTAWVEGKSGYGVGEWIEFKFSKENLSESKVKLNGLYLFNGYRKSLNTWQENSRIKRLKMFVNGKDFAILNLKDSYKMQTSSFSNLNLQNIESIRFQIMEVYKGSKYLDVALSELKFEGTHQH